MRLRVHASAESDCPLRWRSTEGIVIRARSSARRVKAVQPFRVHPRFCRVEIRVCMDVKKRFRISDFEFRI
jgi:hypothetical protein